MQFGMGVPLYDTYGINTYYHLWVLDGVRLDEEAVLKTVAGKTVAGASPVPSAILEGVRIDEDPVSKTGAGKTVQGAIPWPSAILTGRSVRIIKAQAPSLNCGFDSHIAAPAVISSTEKLTLPSLARRFCAGPAGTNDLGKYSQIR